MMVVADENLIERVQCLRSHGMTSLTWDRHHGHAWSYDVVALGYNYRLDEIRSSLGRVQLKKLAGNNVSRRELTDYYRKKIAEVVPEITVPFVGHAGVGSAHIMPILLPVGVDRIGVMEQMKKQGVQTSIHYRPIFTFEQYKKLGYSSDGLPITETLAGRELTLPLYPELSYGQIDLVVEGLSAALKKTA